MSGNSVNASRRPEFSIVTPTYNRADTFARAAASVARQTYKNFEFVVVDDCSPHSYASAVCQALNISCRVIENTSNLGAAGSRNAGVAAAQGKFISFLDDDDELTESFLENTYACLKDSPSEVGLSWCSACCIDYSRTADVPPTVRNKIFKTEYSSREELLNELFSVGIGFGVTIKKECFERVGLFDKNFRTVEDTDIFLRILSAGYLPKVVPGGPHIKLHNHTNQRLTGVAMHHRRINETKQLVERHQKFLSGYPLIDERLKRHIEFLEDEIECVL